MFFLTKTMEHVTSGVRRMVILDSQPLQCLNFKGHLYTKIHIEYPTTQNVCYFIRYTCVTSHVVVCSWDGYRLCREGESIT